MTALVGTARPLSLSLFPEENAMTRTRKLLFSAVALVGVAGLSTSLLVSPAVAQDEASHDHAAVEAVKVGQAAPDFTLMNQNGEPVKLSDHKGKIVVIEQFNDQCPYVQKFYTNGDMNKMADKAEAMGVVWLAMDSSNFSNVEQNKEIAEKWSIDRPLLDDSDGTVGHQYGSKTTPHMFVIDKDGTLAYAGAIDDNRSSDPADIAGATNYVMAAVESVMAGETPTPNETKPYGCTVKY